MRQCLKLRNLRLQRLNLRPLNLLALTTVMLATACTGGKHFATDRKLDDVEKLRHASEVGSPFTQALTREYRNFAVREQDRFYDYPDALHFARKGLLSAKGNIVTPEPVNDWHIDKDKVSTFIDARSRLMRALDVGARDTHPVIAAKAQASFDCWLEQQEENWQSNDIQSCKNRFLTAMADLEHILSRTGAPSDVISRRQHPDLPEAPIDTQKKVSDTRDAPDDNLPASVKEPLTPDNAKYLTFFDFDSADVDESARNVLKAIVDEMRTNPSLNTLQIVGHADTSGPQSYNQSLSLQRAKTVQDALVDLGVNASRIDVSSRGENDLLVETSDNVREPANRRVEILFE